MSHARSMLISGRFHCSVAYCGSLGTNIGWMRYAACPRRLVPGRADFLDRRIADVFNLQLPGIVLRVDTDDQRADEHGSRKDSTTKSTHPCILTVDMAETLFQKVWNAHVVRTLPS